MSRGSDHTTTHNLSHSDDTHHFSPLKLCAKDDEDLCILSSHLQDAFVPLHGMVFDAKNRIFSMLFHRFCWEHRDKHTYNNTPLYHRVSSGLSFHHIQKVHHLNLHDDLLHPQDDEATILQNNQLHHYYPINLLTLSSAPFDDHILLQILFSGGKALKLKVDTLHCTLGDLSHPWPTLRKPHHP